MDADLPWRGSACRAIFRFLKITGHIYSVVPFRFTLRSKGGASDPERSL